MHFAKELWIVVFSGLTAEVGITNHEIASQKWRMVGCENEIDGGL